MPTSTRISDKQSREQKGLSLRCLRMFGRQNTAANGTILAQENPTVVLDTLLR